jgi:predicted deacylase
MAKQAVEIAGNTIQPGEKGYGFLHVNQLVGGTEVRVPYQVINGAHEGPTLCLESTMHGWEPMPAESIRRAGLLIDPAELRGTIYCLPIAHPFTLEFGGTGESAGQRVSPADNLDINQVWPGSNKHAWLTQQIAYVLWNEVIAKCDYVLDCHDGVGSANEIPVAFMNIFPDEPPYITGGGVEVVAGDGAEGAHLNAENTRAINEKVEAMGKAFGARVSWYRKGPLNPRMLLGQCSIQGIVPLYVEIGGGGVIDETIDQGVTGILNIVKHLDMIDGDLELPEEQLIVDNYLVYRANRGGFYLKEPDADKGATVTKGQVLGRVIDPITSEVLETCVSPMNAIVVSSRVRMPINPGGYVAHLADLDAVIWRR